MEFESYANFVPSEAATVSLDITLEELDAILEVDTVNTVPPDLNDSV